MTDKLFESHKVKNVLENLSVRDFRNFGLHQVSYIRKTQSDEGIKFMIHAADGEEILEADSLEVAAVLSRQNDLEPMRCH